MQVDLPKFKEFLGQSLHSQGMSGYKLPHPFSWYYRSFEVDCKCPFCKSETIYSTRNNDVIFCRHYGCYVSLYDCESQFSEDGEGEGGCKYCSSEPSRFCPIEKTSISSYDCEDKGHPYCKTCKSQEIFLPTQGELTSDLVWVCDDCQKVVDFTHQRVSNMFP